MLYRGTGKAEHGYRIAVVMDPDSRLILGYSVNTSKSKYASSFFSAMAKEQPEL